MSSSPDDPHSRARRPPAKEEDDDDPVENMLKRSGCLKLHYKVQECIVDHKDWRKCKGQVEEFKRCVEQDQNRRRGGSDK